jgi:hypothetical protein
MKRYFIIKSKIMWFVTLCRAKESRTTLRCNSDNHSHFCEKLKSNIYTVVCLRLHFRYEMILHTYKMKLYYHLMTCVGKVKM